MYKDYRWNSRQRPHPYFGLGHRVRFGSFKLKDINRSRFNPPVFPGPHFERPPPPIIPLSKKTPLSKPVTRHGPKRPDLFSKPKPAPLQRPFVMRPLGQGPKPVSSVPSPGDNFEEMQQKVAEALSLLTLTSEDKIFLIELDALGFDRNVKTSIRSERDALGRGEKEGAQKWDKARADALRCAKEAEREAERERRLREKLQKEAERIQEENRRVRLEEERHRKEAFKAEQARREKERIERERIHREKEEAERKRREATARARAEEEAQRRAQLETENAQTAQILDLYDAKWEELRTNPHIPPLVFSQLPWPVMSMAVDDPSHITYARVYDFVFHPARKGMDGKSRRERVKADILKWHPDKFESKILPKMVDCERAVVSQVAGTVVRLLTQILAEEVEQERRV